MAELRFERVGTSFQGDGMVANVSSGSHTDVAVILNFTDKDLVTIGANVVSCITRAQEVT